ncbi:class I SAM-dependent methyltransferase [Paenibacillus sp. MMO-58]|uniref:class I SAM-dependent methyltransferase n=1 Tax=Paenibacillus sp. MMO-58 TaxID=3081290 RepID=UPI003016DC99
MNTIMRESWNNRAQQYARRMDKLMNALEYQQQWQQKLQALLGNKQELQILDAATGSGFLAIHLAQLGHRVTGLDFSEEMLRIAELRAKSMGLDCSFVYGFAEDLPFHAEQFDVMVCRNLLGSLSDSRQAVFMEWRRVLKSGGRVLIWDGDWTARNLFPFAQSQLSSGRKPHRQAKIKRQGIIKRNPYSSLLYNDVALELEAAGFINMTACDKETKLMHGLQEAKLQCEPLFISAQKP